MKKFLLFIAALLVATSALVVTSCHNTGPVMKKTTIRVNLSTVMSNFTYQVNAGDLDGVIDDHTIRVRLYLYDENGYLQESQEESARNYLSSVMFDTELPEEENFTAIVITDVVTKKSGAIPEYWDVVDAENINSLKINYAAKGKDPYGAQEILGVKSSMLRSGDNINIDVEAAGAMVCTRAVNVHAYSDVQYIWVFGDRGNDNYYFSSYGDLNYNPDLDEMPDFTFIDVDDFNYGVYSYKFIMPQTNYKFTLLFLNDDFDTIAGSVTSISSLAKGREYLCAVILDPDDDGSGNFTYGVVDVTGQTARSESRFEMSGKMEKSENLFPAQHQTSWKVKDLIK